MYKLLIPLFFAFEPTYSKPCPMPVSKDIQVKVSRQLKGMAYSIWEIEKCWGIAKCPDGHDNFVVAFRGKRWGKNLSGYFCPPYVNQSVVYSNEKLE